MADGTLKVGTITTSSGSGNIAIGSGVTLLSNTPAFDAYLSADQSGNTNQAYNLVKFDAVYFDTDNSFDTTDGQNKFIVPSNKAGKYCFYSGIEANPSADNQTLLAQLALYKNGVIYRETRAKYNTSSLARYAPLTLTTVLDLEVDDYIQIYFYGDDSLGAHRYESNNTFFGGYKLGA